MVLGVLTIDGWHASLLRRVTWAVDVHHHDPNRIILTTPTRSNQIQIRSDDVFIIFIGDRHHKRMRCSWCYLTCEFWDDGIIPSSEALDDPGSETCRFGHTTWNGRVLRNGLRLIIVKVKNVLLIRWAGGADDEEKESEIDEGEMHAIDSQCATLWSPTAVSGLWAQEGRFSPKTEVGSSTYCIWGSSLNPSFLPSFVLVCICTVQSGDGFYSTVQRLIPLKYSSVTPYTRSKAWRHFFFNCSNSRPTTREDYSHHFPTSSSSSCHPNPREVYYLTHLDGLSRNRYRALNPTSPQNHVLIRN